MSAALVVGATGGLGSAITQRLASERAALVLTYRSNKGDAERLAQTLDQRCQSIIVQLDLRDEASIAAAFTSVAQGFGGIDTVIFASGVSIPQPYVSQITDDQWMEVIAVELLGFTRLVRGALPQFRKQGMGNFVSLTSFANVHFPPGDALSSVPKAGIESLSRAIAKEEGRYGIRANCVAPGIVNAGLGRVFQEKLFDPSVWETQRKRVPLRRFAEAADIAEVVAFLASDRSRYMTGQTLIVDGGLSL